MIGSEEESMLPTSMRLVLPAAWMLAAALALAQETTGSIVGTVTSGDGAPLPGATVKVEDPERGLERVVESDHTGSFAVPALPPASYRLRASLDGFTSVALSVLVELGRTASVPVEMTVGAFADEIEVTSEAPVMDLSSTVAGFTVDAGELLSRIPVGREATQIAMLAPATYAADPWWQQPAITGLFTPGQGFVSFSGSSFGENSYQLNGLNITNFRDMMGSSFVPMEFVDEVQVTSGGWQAEFGRATGGVISMVTKSGTNDFRGGLSAYWEPESLQEQAPDTIWFHNQEEGRESLELNASLGGPMLRDRLFFFAFVRYSDNWFTDYYTVSADLHESAAPYWGAKLDWNLGSEHRLEATYLSDQADVDFTRWSYDAATRTLLEKRGTGVRRRGGDNLILKYSGLLSPALLLSAQAGHNEFDRTNFTDGDECPLAIDYRVEPEAFLGCWVRTWRGTDLDTRRAYRADVDWFVGPHSLRAGADWERNLADSTQEYSGGVSYGYFLNGTPDQAPEDYRYPGLPWDQDLVAEDIEVNGGEYEIDSSAAYVQDSWSVTPGLTLNLGLRWEAYANKNGLGGTFIETDDQWAPRLGVAWDPSGAGRSKLSASFGTYHLPVSALVSIRYAGAFYSTTTWYAFDGNVANDGSPVALGDQLERFDWADGVTPDPREGVSENFEPMALNEASIGYERQLGSYWKVGLRGVARWYEQVIEDFSLYEGLWTTYQVACLDPELIGTEGYCWSNGWRLGNPGRDFEGWYDIDGDGVLDEVVVPAEALGYPAAERDYYAVELSFARRFADRWMLSGSYTWSHLYGNYGGTINEEWGTANAGMSEAFDYPYMMEHSRGDLSGDLRHVFKLYGAYAWDFGLQAGASAFFQSGRPFNSWGRHPDDPWAAATNYLSFYTAGEPTPRGCCGRTDALWGLDLMLVVDFPALGVDWTLRLDAFNAFNVHQVSWPYPIAEDPANGAPEAGYGEPYLYQAPRSVRLGCGLRF
jgi:outer membrane receptor protein involved in Fe transport